MVQKLLIMERDTEDGLQDAIEKNILQADNSSRISAISVLESQYGSRTIMKAWIIVEVPENKDRLYDLAAGFEST